jgi:hypothetical protein
MKDLENQTENRTLLEAFRWVTNGVAVIPCRPQDKRPALRRWGKYQMELPSAEDLHQWFTGQNRFNNLAVVTGWNNLVVIDFDDLEKYFEWQEFIEDHYPDAMKTFQVLTGRGAHIYYRVHNPVLNQKLDKIDIKARGGYVLAPPSIHPSGGYYWPLRDDPLMKILSIKQVLPAKWLKKGGGYINAVRDITPGFISRSQTENPQTKTKPKTKPEVSKPRASDPWAIAEDPGQSEDVITRIRNHISILDYFPDAVQTDSNFYVARCPFHEDHNPSFWINTEKQICNCYKCQFTCLDAINLHAALNNLTNAQAIRELGKTLMEGVR